MSKQEAEDLRIIYDTILYFGKPDEYKHELAKRDFIRRQIELSKFCNKYDIHRKRFIECV